MAITHAPTHRHPSTWVDRRSLGAFLVLHGVAHFVGLSANIDLARDHRAAALLGGVWHVNSRPALLALAIAWGVVGAAVIVTALLIDVGARSSRRVMTVVAAVSLALSIVNLWAAVVGVVINASLLAVGWIAPQRLGLAATSDA